MRPTTDDARAVLDGKALRELIPLLQRRGYQVMGPTLHDGSIVYDVLNRVEDLPAGWAEEQEAGRYRLKKRGDDVVFGYVTGAQTWKKFLHPPEIRLFEAQREGATFRIIHDENPPPRYALLGVRACDLAAIRAQDQVLTGPKSFDPVYRARREHALIIAVQCTHSAPTCFCASMETGPRAGQGFDLALTEVFHDGRHLFVAEAGTPEGTEILQELGYHEAPPELSWLAAEAVDRAAAEQVRRVDTAGLREAIDANFDHARWDQTASRCMSCGNCTMVCPTCFCTTVEDVSDVTGTHAERWRKWDSCFTQSFSYIHGGSVRKSAKSRLRQWITHKLAYWVDQFGGFGCTGCGRCITWCPGAIDITEEARALQNGGAISKNKGVA